VALAFLLRHPDTFVVPKASSIAHVEENAGAANCSLSDADIATIDAAFPRGRSRTLPML
jgi:aryl-alcohol dehydrogenase-like predicted oxidoreductase